METSPNPINCRQSKLSWAGVGVEQADFETEDFSTGYYRNLDIIDPIENTIRLKEAESSPLPTPGPKYGKE